MVSLEGVHAGDYLHLSQMRLHLDDSRIHVHDKEGVVYSFSDKHVVFKDGSLVFLEDFNIYTAISGREAHNSFN